MEQFNLQTLRQLAEEHGLSLVVLFGSRARGEAQERSDTDIAFLPNHRKDVLEVAKMQLEFSEALHLKDIELVDLSGRAPLFLKQVADDGQVLYEEKAGLFDEFQIYAFKRYVEAKPLLALRKAFMLNFISSHAHV